MLVIHSPAGTEGMFSAVHALAQEQLMDADLAAALALKHDTVMIEQSKDRAARGRSWADRSDRPEPAQNQMRSPGEQCDGYRDPAALHVQSSNRETSMRVYPQELTPAAFEPFGHVIEPRRTGEQFDRSNPYVPGVGHDRVPLVLTNGEPVLRIMHQRLRGLRFGKMARHMRVSQCLGSIGGKDWFLAVAAPGNTVAPDQVAAFHIPGDRIVKLHVGTWHAGPHFVHEEAMFLNLENTDTNLRDFGELVLPEECVITPPT